MNNKLKELRKKCGYSQIDISKKLGYNQTLISKWELGTRDPSTEALIKLSELYNISIDELLNNTKFIANTNNGISIPDEKKATVELLCKLPEMYYANIEGRIQAYAQISNII